MKENRRKTIIIIMFLILASFTIITSIFSVKLIVISAELLIISDDIQVYNESKRKTDSMTKEAIELFEFREREFYNSQDVMVRWFSNLHSILKAIVIFADFALICFLINLWSKIIVTLKRERRIRKRRRKRRRRK